MYPWTRFGADDGGRSCHRASMIDSTDRLAADVQCEKREQPTRLRSADLGAGPSSTMDFDAPEQSTFTAPVCLQVQASTTVMNSLANHTKHREEGTHAELLD